MKGGFREGDVGSCTCGIGWISEGCHGELKFIHKVGEELSQEKGRHSSYVAIGASCIRAEVTV